MINTNLLNYYETILESPNYKHTKLSIADLIRSETGINYNIVPQKAPIWVREQLISCPANYLTDINNGTLFAQAMIPADLVIGKGLQNVYLFRIWYLAQNEKLNFDNLPENAVEYRTIAKRMPSYKPEKSENNYCEICGEYWLNLKYHQTLERCKIHEIKANIAQFNQIKDKENLIPLAKSNKRINEVLMGLNQYYRTYSEDRLPDNSTSYTKTPTFSLLSLIPYAPSSLFKIIKYLDKHKYKPKQIIL